MSKPRRDRVHGRRLPAELTSLDAIVAAIIGGIAISVVGAPSSDDGRVRREAPPIAARPGAPRDDRADPGLRPSPATLGALASVPDVPRPPSGFPIRPPQYSVKANDVPAVIGEVTAPASTPTSSRAASGPATRAGFTNRRITLRGSARPLPTCARRRAAPDGRPLCWVALESPEEAAALEREVARGGRATLDVLYRLNPEVGLRP